MVAIQLLILEDAPEVMDLFLAQIDQARPGRYKACSACSLQEFRKLANAHKQDVDTVVLGPAQTNEQVQAAKEVIGQVWKQDKVQVLRIPASLVTTEGTRGGGMMRWFLEHVEGAIEGECGCC